MLSKKFMCNMMLDSTNVVFVTAMIDLTVILLALVPCAFSKGCGGLIELTSSKPAFRFQSPGFPYYQAYHYSCQWTVKAIGSEWLYWECEEIDTLTTSQCYYNKVFYLNSTGYEQFCGYYQNVRRWTYDDSFRIFYYQTFSSYITTKGLKCFAHAQFPCSCGKEKIQPRIVGGHETKIHQFSWAVYLLFKNGRACSGSLISSEYILTAAHCFIDIKPSEVKAYLGEHDVSRANETSKTIETIPTDIIIHPNYNKNTEDNDIALLKIPKVPITEEIATICLPLQNVNIYGENGRICGWGQTSLGGLASNTLQVAWVNISTASECRANSKLGSSVTDNMICARENGVDACFGDSGASLFIKGLSGYNIIVGISSFGNGCANPNFPGVYTNVQVYIPWIKSVTAVNFCSKIT